MNSCNCCFLIYIQVSQEAGQVVWYFHLFQNFPQFIVIHTVKGFGIVNKAEMEVFLELSCFFHDPMDVGNLISGSSVFSKTSLNIWKFTVHVLLKPGLENFKHCFTSMWDECNCAFPYKSDITGYLFFSVWLTSLSMRISMSIHCCIWHYLVPLYDWVIFHHLYVPHLYPFLCWLLGFFHILPMVHSAAWG